MQAMNLPPPPSWVLDLNSPPAPRQSPKFADPPGYKTSNPKVTSPVFCYSLLYRRWLTADFAQRSKNEPQSATPRKAPTPAETDTLKTKKAWEIALAPAKSLPMSAIGMYMTGNSLQMFSIMMVFMLFKTPLVALTNINSAFVRYETEGNRDKMLLVKLVYVLTNLMAVGVGVWKVGKMGLLPTTRSDWLAWEEAREVGVRAWPVFPIGR